MIWLMFGGSFRCSNCYAMPDFVDIRNVKVCPRCYHRAYGYETDDGVVSMEEHQNERK